MRDVRHAPKEQDPVAQLRDSLCLRGTALFRSLRDQDLRHLLTGVAYTVYPKGALLVESEAEDRICIIARGAVRLSLLSSRGRALTLHCLRAGDFFDLHNIDVTESLVDGTGVYSIQWTCFLSRACQHPDVVFALITVLRQRALQEQALLKEIAFETMRTRLGRTLVTLAREDPERDVQETHTELGALVGAEREDVTKALSHFRLLGLIQSPDRHRGIRVVGEELRF